MTAAEFRRIPLLRRIPLVDEETGDLYVLEVRRDPATGLTLKAKFPVPPL